MMRKILFLYLGMLSAISMIAQSNSFSGKQKRQFWDAELAYERGDYLTVIKELEKLRTADADYSRLYYIKGDSYFLLDNYDSAKVYLELAKTENVDAYFKLAYLSLNQENIVESNDYLNEYKKLSVNQKSQIPTYESAQLSNNIAFAKKELESPEIVNIINLGEAINSDAHEYVPLISADEELIIFTSRRQEDSNVLDTYGKPFENVYASRNRDNRRWEPAKLIEGSVNTSGHDACVGLSPDGNTLFLFRSNENGVGGDLYESLFVNDNWTTPVRMSENINGALSIEPSASISLDGRTLYFSSNREGGFGGFDLYRVIKLPNGEWSLPLNLGAGVNTIFDDDAPFIHANGKSLYYSSKGFENMGGYDIFKSESKDGIFQSPTNLGYPTNSTKDDIYFTISANEQHGYYSSDKKGGYGKQDIYRIDYLEKSLRQSVISANVMIDGIPSFTEITLLDGESGELVGVFSSNKSTGKFIFLVNPEVKYELIIEGDDFEEYSEMIMYTLEDLMNKQKKVIKLNGQEK